MRVIVTRPAAEAAEWVDALRARGFDAIALPLIDIRIASDTAAMRDAWSRIDSYRAVMFVSANAVRGFFSVHPAGAEFSPRAWATGAGTCAALAQQRVDAIDSPPADSPQFDSEALWEVVKNQCKRGDRVLIVRGGDAGAGIAGRDWLAEQLAAVGVQVEQVLAYERAAPGWTAAHEQLASDAAKDGSMWLFSSSQAIAQLRRCAPGVKWSSARAVATHPRIAQAARDAGFGVVCVSRPPMDAVVRALESAG
ncbi:MAG TPA: uroporphyrinogen-III synthase [Ramlibacter sp.]|nr:uroporphyrinogen-III synthase [Ramlibacter sp.]